MSITRVYNSSLMEAKDNRIHQLETELAEARGLLRESLVKFEALTALGFIKEPKNLTRRIAAMSEALPRCLGCHGVGGSGDDVCPTCEGSGSPLPPAAG